MGKEYSGNSQGHPTLTGGMPARIGGELNYDKSKDIWKINCYSGRYSNDYDYDHESKKKYIERMH